MAHITGGQSWVRWIFGDHYWNPRYAGYGFVALDVVPARTGHRTTITLRFINEQGRELDRVVFSRTAGDCLFR